MKKATLLLCLAAITFACNQHQPATQAEATSETQSAAPDSTFGASFAEENVLSATELVKAVAGQDSLQATVAAEIKESCQSKGCWMDVKLGDEGNMKVTFRDYGFFVPTQDLAGRQVVFTGTAKRELVSVEDLRHFAQDAGKSAEEIAAITEPREELRFVADGVILK
ncbi:DUF4920 domain-containing protein [Pontibacter mangrovi]|uniref:DUF4920 domain-containing protein n=1 Tax=Pontibacter mangrovi TaxID=2589816 RepID=A0A501VVG2_9BACT|nr:DUF4920 domain-containing protein [Pontibacter mangrovi]TPE41058.1 DUF4920 domain-containing protein [Pontibacter mangrovi]